MSVLLPPRPVRCQHCRRDIWQSFTGDWIDSEGFLVCQKYTGPLVDGKTPDYMVHKPMPEVK